MQQVSKSNDVFFPKPPKHVIVAAFTIVFLGVITYLITSNYSSPVIKPSTPPMVDNGRVISGQFDQSKFKTNAEWQKILTKEQYFILRQQGTEVPFSGELLEEKRKGVYVSVGCEQPLFRSEAKFDSGTGWPSFYEPISLDAVVLREDHTLNETRIEVLDKCGGHLGHVFDDGPPPTGKRYCINSDALKFIPDK